MADLISQGVYRLTVDGSEAVSGLSEIDAAFDGVNRSAQLAGASASGAMQKTAAGAGAAGASTEKLDATTQRFIRSLERESQQAGRTRAEYLELRAAQLGAAGAADPFIKRIREQESALQKAGIAFNQYGLSAKQTSAALRQVPAQLTDIAVSLQGGQNPLTVFLQQGGQLRDVFGGAVPAVKALGSAVLGLVNPFTLVGGAVAALTAGYFFGSKEADEYAKSLILTGNAAGATVSELNSIAAAIGAVAGTQGNAAAALAQVAGSGEVASSNLQKVTLAAVQLERTAGVAVGDTVKQFAELGKAPAEASIRLNQQYRYLTLSVLEQIRALEKQGLATEAASVAQNAFADALLNRSGQLEARLGTIERGWLAIKDAVKGAADAILDVGRIDTSSSLQKQVDALERLRPVGNGPEASAYQVRIDDLKARIASLQEVERLNKRVAGAEAQRVAQAEAGIKAEGEIERIRKESATNQEKLNKELADYRRNIEAIRKANPQSILLDPERIKKDEANIRERFRDKRGAGVQRGIDRSEVNFDISEIRKGLESVTGAYRNAESILDALRQSGLTSESEYYEAKRKFIELNSAAQRQALLDENERLSQEKLSGKDRIDNDRKIAENKAKMAVIQANASTQTVLLNLREQSSLAQLKRGYEEARLAQQALLDAQRQANERNLSGLGQGTEARERTSRVNDIDDRFSQERARIEAERQLLRIQQEGSLTDEQSLQFERRLELLGEFHEKALTEEEIYQARMSQLQGDFTVGASEALNNYLAESANVAKQVEDLFSNAFQGMEDALVQFIQTGKLDFKSLADSITADILRIIIKQQISNALAEASKIFGGGGTGTAGFIGQVFGALVGTRADGGPVASGAPYLVGEEGPELFVPRSAGTIIPSNMLNNNQRTVNVANNFTISGPVDRRTQEQIASAARRGVEMAAARGTA